MPYKIYTYEDPYKLDQTDFSFKYFVRTGKTL